MVALCCIGTLAPLLFARVTTSAERRTVEA